jgi:hypothetical protein
MKTGIQILTVFGLMAGLAFAQDKNGSVRSVMNELAEVQGATPPVVAPAAQSAPAPAAAAPAEETAEPVDVPALVEQSRKQYVAGSYVHAEEGFTKAIAADPGNKLAAYYLDQLRGVNHRDAEETALKQLSSEWNMILRYYPVTDRFVKNMKLDDAGGAGEIKEQLMKASVEFPKGSSVRYLPELRKLFVENTPANLVKLEQVMSAFGNAEKEDSSEQVKIETRFVEFSEGALQELGFNWSDASGSGVGLAGDWRIQDGADLFSGALRTLPFDQTQSLGLGETRAAGNWRANRIDDMFNSGAGTLGLSGNIGNSAIDLLIRALDQTAGVDVLSAPSVVTSSGQPAVITVGERHFYPET